MSRAEQARTARRLFDEADEILTRAAEDQRLEILCELAAKRDEYAQAYRDLYAIRTNSPKDAEILGDLLPALERMVMELWLRTDESIAWNAGRYAGPRPEHLKGPTS